MTTIRDVARLAGVAPSTASLALNSRKRVNSNTRQKVLQAAQDLGYIPNSLAKNLTAQRTGIIGILMAEIINPYHASLTHFIQKELRKRSYRMNLGITEGEALIEEEVLKDFISQKVDGVLIHTADIINFNLSTFYELIKRKIPTVLIGGGIEGISLPIVDVELEKGSYSLTRYLTQRGYKRFLFLSGLKAAMTFKRRIDGFQKAMLENGYPVWETDIVETHPDIEGGYTSALEIFNKNHPDYDVILCVNDYMAFGVLKALRELRIKVPENIGLTGFDDISFASVAGVPLTTVHIPIEELAVKSVDLLYQRILYKESSEEKSLWKKTVDTQVVVRQSTR
jgi:LacI family transcriptional regulator